MNINKTDMHRTISIIVITFNRAEKISFCLDSLLNQSYPKKLFEIIVVNDGSIDDTNKVLNEYPVKIVNHKSNLGIPFARNTGLKAAKGEIVAYIDDDCTADKNWLKNLVKGYNNPSIVAIGGSIRSANTNTLSEWYLASIGYGNPSVIDYGKSKNPINRFIAYIKDMLQPLTLKSGLFEVQDIYTSNASYRRAELLKIGGFDDKLLSSEDTDLSTRLHNNYPEKKIVFTSYAITYHKHESSIINYLKQIFIRSENTYNYYSKNKKIPPIFPFPVLIVFFSLLIVNFNLIYGVIVFLLLTQFLYIWWPIRFIKRRNRYILLFPYIQFCAELFTILGMLFGIIKNRLN